MSDESSSGLEDERGDGLHGADVAASDAMVDAVPLGELRAFAKAWVRMGARLTEAAFHWEERAKKAEKITERLERIEQLLIQGGTTMSQLDDALANLTAQAAAETTEVQAAVNYIKGTPALIVTAVQEAIAAGATPAQLASISAVAEGLQANVAAASAAIAANTPSAPSAPAAPAPTPAAPATP